MQQPPIQSHQSKVKVIKLSAGEDRPGPLNVKSIEGLANNVH